MTKWDSQHSQLNESSKLKEIKYKLLLITDYGRIVPFKFSIFLLIWHEKETWWIFCAYQILISGEKIFDISCSVLDDLVYCRLKLVATYIGIRIIGRSIPWDLLLFYLTFFIQWRFNWCRFQENRTETNAQ